LEAEKAALRADLRLTTTLGSSLRGDLGLASYAIPTPSTSIQSRATSVAPPIDEPTLDFGDEEQDTIREEPSYDVFKRSLDREKILKVKLPEAYTGKNIKEWKSFTTGWEAVFRAQPWTYNTHSSRVNAAATTLRGNPHDLWEANLKNGSFTGPLTWGKFSAFLADMIQAPGTRSQDAFEELRDLRQGLNESVSELFTRMITYEADRGTMNETDRVRTLDAALTNQETKKMLVSILGGRMASSVSEWLEIAQRAEHTVNKTRRSRHPGGNGANQGSNSNANNNSSPDAAKDNRRKRKEKARKSQQSSGDGQASSSKPSSGSNAARDVTCYTCSQKGHYSGDKRCSKYADWVRDNPDKAKAKEDAAAA
jgi:hypothetical protein